MKKTLIITAHPSSAGHTHIIADTYKEEAEIQNHEVRLYDLYKTEHQLPFLAFENFRDEPTDPDVAFFQGEVMWANEIVFIHPIWWSGPPAILKNWFDHVFAAHFAYKYVNEKAVGLLSPRKAKVFVTTGGHAWLHSLPLSPFRLITETMINGFCGLENTTFLVCGNMSKSKAEERFNAFLKKVKNSVAL